MVEHDSLNSKIDYLVEHYDTLFASFQAILLAINFFLKSQMPNNYLFKQSNQSARCQGDCLPKYFLTLQTPNAQNIENRK